MSIQPQPPSSPPAPPPVRPHSFIRSAFSVGAILILGSLVGFARQVIVTSRFGASADYDAFYAAFRIPDLLFNLLAGGALASAFIPVFTARLSLGERVYAWRLARTAAGLVFAVLGGLALIASALAPLIIRATIAPGFSDEQIQVTAALMRVMLAATVIFGVSGLLMGVLQSNASFVGPALAPALYNVGIIAGATLLGESGIYGLAYGVVLGAVLHLGVQLPALARVLWRQLGTRGKEAGGKETGGEETGDRRQEAGGRRQGADIRQILRLMLPRIVGLGAVQFNFIVNTNLASTMGAGGVSALNIAFAVMLLPQAAIAQAIATVLFPSISAHAARGERAEFGAMVTRAAGAVLLLSIPASIGLILMGQPLIRLLFQRGAFDAGDTEAVAFALAWFGAGLVGHSVLEVATRGFYALQDTLRPVILGVASMAVNVALSLALSSLFRSLGLYPFGGLALANTLATALETALLLGLLTRRAPELDARHILRAALTCTLAGLAMAAVLAAWMAGLGTGPLATALALPLAAAVYFGAAFALGHDETRAAARQLPAIARRLRRK